MKKLIRNSLSLIEWREGIIGGLFAAAVVWSLNIVISSPTDWAGSTTAALKQGIYTLLIGGFLIKLTRYLSTQWQQPIIAYPISVTIPGSIATFLIYCIHSFRGTPEPMQTTILIGILSFTVLPFLAYNQRNQVSNAAAK